MTRLAAILLSLASLAAAQEHIRLTAEDGGGIDADVYGKSDRGVVLVHGGRFNKESWAKQARALDQAGYRAVAINLRGYGHSTGPGQADLYTAPLYQDVIAAIRYLQKSGAKSI